MARLKKGVVRPGHGTMCNICGLSCGKGGGLAAHLDMKHSVSYDAYKICFFGAERVIMDSWNDSISMSKGGVKKKMVIHTLVRLFHQDQNSKPVTRSVMH